MSRSARAPACSPISASSAAAWTAVSIAPGGVGGRGGAAGAGAIGLAAVARLVAAVAGFPAAVARLVAAVAGFPAAVARFPAAAGRLVPVGLDELALPARGLGEVPLEDALLDAPGFLAARDLAGAGVALAPTADRDAARLAGASAARLAREVPFAFLAAGSFAAPGRAAFAFAFALAEPAAGFAFARGPRLEAGLAR